MPKPCHVRYLFGTTGSRSGIYAVPQACQLRYLCSATALSCQGFSWCNRPVSSGIYAVPRPVRTGIYAVPHPVRAGIYAVPLPCQGRYSHNTTALLGTVFMWCQSPVMPGIYLVPQAAGQVFMQCHALLGQVFMQCHKPVSWGIYAVPRPCEIRYSCGATKGSTNFPITWEPPPYFRHRKGAMNQSPHWGPRYVVHHHINYSCPGDLAPVVPQPCRSGTTVLKRMHGKFADLIFNGIYHGEY
jgi:hypothetical protein